MQELDHQKTIDILNSIMEFELAGVVRYTHYSLMVTGPNRIPIVAFFKAQAAESLLHAQQVGEILTGLEGHPTLRIAPMEETFKHMDGQPYVILGRGFNIYCGVYDKAACK